MNAYVFKIGNFGVRWYSLLILIGVIVGILLIEKEGKKFNISKDFLFNMAFWAIIIGIIGARLYYVIFNFNITAIIVSISAVLSSIEELIIIISTKELNENCKSIFKM